MVKTNIYIQNAYAKVNLNLYILGFKNNGYSILNSLVVFADIADIVTLQQDNTFSLKITGPMAHILKKKSSVSKSLHHNIISRTIDSFRRITGIKDNFSITLEKHLPIAAGLGGGSADAAAILRILEKMYPTVTHFQILQICKILGSDISVCYYQRPALMQDTGNKLHFFSLPSEIALVLIHPIKKCSTREIFDAYKASHTHKNTMVKSALPYNWIEKTKTRDDFFDLILPAHNDLFPFAAEKIPELHTLMDDLNNLDDCIFANMSGSGATCFALFDSLPKAHQAQLKLRYLYPHYWIHSVAVKNLTRIPTHHM